VASGVPDLSRRGAFAGLWLFAAVACLSIAAQNVLFLGLAAWIALLWKQGRWPRPLPILWIWVLFVLWALAASCYSDNAAHSLLTWKKWLLGFLILYIADAVESRRDLRALLGATLFFGGLCCLGAVLWALRGPLGSALPWREVLAQWPERGEWRAVSGSGGYMVLGSCSMLLLVFFLGLWIKDRSWRSPLASLCLASLALGLLMTQTRSAWLGAAAGGFALLWSWRKGLALALLGSALLLLLAFPNSPISKRVRDGWDINQNSTRERMFMFETGGAILRQHPWLGVGDALESFDGHPGYYLQNFPQEHKDWESLRGKDEGHLHDNFLQVAVMYGLPALCLLLLFFGRMGLGMARDHGQLAGPAGAALLAWFVNGLFEYNFGSLQSSFLLWFLLGLYFAGVKLDESPAH
jgi:O-antigen ligase